MGTGAPRLVIGTTADGKPFSLPANLLATGRTCVLGASGSGKSYALGVLCEELCKAGVPFCIIDLEGEYWGIKDRYEAIWVGDRDICDAHWNEIDLDRLVRAAPNAPPLILDFSRVDHQLPAVSAFLTPLWKASADGRFPYLIILDEADRVVPRAGPRMDVVFEIAVRGRKRGLGLMLCTQRPFQVDQDVIGQCTVQLVGRLLLEVDLRAVGPFFGKEKVEGLAQLERGRFWVLGEGKPTGELVAVRTRETSHKSETPELTINRVARPSEEVLRAIRGDRPARPQPPLLSEASSSPGQGEPPRQPALHRLAVLPFANISPDPKDEYFADGLTEELITVLSQLQELRVIARTSVGLYKASPKSVSQIGAELGVDTVLEGSVRKAGDKLRITVQLIDVGSQEHTWSNTYDRKLENVFAVQTEIAKRVAKQLKVNVWAAEEARLEGRPAVRSDSYLAYLQGRTLLHGVDRASLERAKEQFELAISLDPKNAAAHSGLADVTRMTGWWYPGIPRAKWSESSRRLTTRAIELDPNLAEAHASLASTLWDNYEWAPAEKEFQRALSLNPSYSLAHVWYAALLKDEARPNEALQEHALAEAADPLWTFNLDRMADLLIWLGRLEAALAKTQRIGELEPDSLDYHAALARYYLALPDLGRCAQELHRVEELEPDPRWKSLYRAWYYAVSGKKEEARSVLRHEEPLPEFGQITANIARVYAELGDSDECFRLLERASDSHTLPIQQFRLDPRLEAIRADPRFPVLLRKMNLA